jgi:hypothetical protein
MDGGLRFQLFAVTGLFRNQQVAGSTPAGGSTSFSIDFPARSGIRRPIHAEAAIGGLTSTRFAIQLIP